jgi:hypothetical protein
MATILNRTQTFATNGTVTAAGLHNLIDDTGIYAGLITTQTELTTVGTADQLLIAVGGVSDTGAPRRATVQNLFEDTLTAGTFAGLNLTGALTYGTATGTRLVSANATITTGTITTGVIPNLTAGTTTSTAATITNGTITNLASTTGTITNLSTTLAGDFTISSGTGTLGTTGATLGTYGGATSVPVLAINAKGQVTSTGTAAITSGLTGFRNRIIGGDFGINPWQRGTTIAVAAAGNLYTADRFKSYNNTDGAYSVIKTADAPTVANAVINTEYCLDVDVTTADASLAVGQICQGVIQKIEGYNVASFGFGKAGTRYVTLSFWVKSTKTGIFYVNFTNSASNRCYPAQYTVSVTNTWENKVITVPVDTSGTWDYTNGEGLNLIWTIASNSATTGTANTWGTNGSVPNDQVNALDSTSNNFKLALIQLEAGSTATDFECRPIGTELALCQRYYYRMVSDFSFGRFGASYNTATTSGLAFLNFAVPMRSSPTALDQTGTAADYAVIHQQTSTVCSAVPSLNSANKFSAVCGFTVASGLVAGHGSQFASASGVTTAFLGWSAEL